MAFQGTVVTIENFLAWKATFDLEMSELRRKKQKEEEQGGKAKLTGRTSPRGGFPSASQVRLNHWNFLIAAAQMRKFGAEKGPVSSSEDEDVTSHLQSDKMKQSGVSP